MYKIAIESATWYLVITEPAGISEIQRDNYIQSYKCDPDKTPYKTIFHHSLEDNRIPLKAESREDAIREGIEVFNKLCKYRSSNGKVYPVFSEILCSHHIYLKRPFELEVENVNP